MNEFTIVYHEVYYNGGFRLLITYIPTPLENYVVTYHTQYAFHLFLSHKKFYVAIVPTVPRTYWSDWYHVSEYRHLLHEVTIWPLLIIRPLVRIRKEGYTAMLYFLSSQKEIIGQDQCNIDKIRNTFTNLNGDGSRNKKDMNLIWPTPIGSFNHLSAIVAIFLNSNGAIKDGYWSWMSLMQNIF